MSPNIWAYFQRKFAANIFQKSPKSGHTESPTTNVGAKIVSPFGRMTARKIEDIFTKFAEKHL